MKKHVMMDGVGGMEEGGGMDDGERDGTDGVKSSYG
jgi:hypothetical protein